MIVVFAELCAKQSTLNGLLIVTNQARSRLELILLELRRALIGEARGPGVHLCHKLFLGVSMRNVYGSQTAELK